MNYSAHSNDYAIVFVWHTCSRGESIVHILVFTCAQLMIQKQMYAIDLDSCVLDRVTQLFRVIYMLKCGQA